jgi:hypothetical protein
VLALGAGIGVTGCGSGQSQGATEPTGNFPVQVTTAKFPNHQKLDESSYLVLAIKNAGSQTIPDLAVTINTQAKGTPNLKSPATSTGRARCSRRPSRSRAAPAVPTRGPRDGRWWGWPG